MKQIKITCSVIVSPIFRCVFILIFSPLISLILNLLRNKWSIFTIRINIWSYLLIWLVIDLLRSIGLLLSSSRFYSSNFNSLMNFSTVDLFDISTSKNIVLINTLFINHFRNYVQISVHNVRDNFKRWLSFWFVQHRGTNENITSKSLNPNNNLVNDLSSLLIRKFFEQNNFGVRFSVGRIE